MKRLLFALGLLFCAANAGAQTTTFNGVVEDLTNTPVPTGQVTFQLKPGIDATISGSSRFVPATTFCEIHNPGVVSTSGTGTITVVVGTAQAWRVGDSLIFVGTADATLNASTVATPYTVTLVNSTTSFVFTQSGAHVNGAGGSVGGLYKSGGTGACAVMQNTAITPQNTSYTVGIQAIFAQPSSFNTYAIGAGPVDISTVVPTPSQMPAYSFVDTFSNQAIGGNKTFAGNLTAIAGQNILCVYNADSIVFVDGGATQCTGPKYATIAAAIAALPSGATGGGLILLPCATASYAGPTITQSGVSIRGMCAGGGIGIASQEVHITYSSNLNIANLQNIDFENVVLEFGQNGVGVHISSSQTIRFRNVTLNQCGNTTTPCVLLDTNCGTGGLCNTTDLRFENLKIYCNDAGGQYCQSGMKEIGQASSFVTLNYFYNVTVRGNVLYANDAEVNSDTEFFYGIQELQAGTAPANSALVAFNLLTPGSDQDVNGSHYYDLGYTGNGPATFIRAGAASGNIISGITTLGGLPSVTNLGGANFYLKNKVETLQLNAASPVQNPSSSIPGTLQVGRISPINATQLTTGAFGFNVGGGAWGTSPAFNSVRGTDALFQLTLTSGSGVQTANPTLNLTFADGTWNQIPICTLTRGDANAPAGGYWVQSGSSTATILTLVFVGTTVASTQYIALVSCGQSPN